MPAQYPQKNRFMATLQDFAANLGPDDKPYENTRRADMWNMGMAPEQIQQQQYLMEQARQQRLGQQAQFEMQQKQQAASDIDESYYGYAASEAKEDRDPISQAAWRSLGQSGRSRLLGVGGDYAARPSARIQELDRLMLHQKGATGNPVWIGEGENKRLNVGDGPGQANEHDLALDMYWQNRGADIRGQYMGVDVVDPRGPEPARALAQGMGGRPSMSVEEMARKQAEQKAAEAQRIRQGQLNAVKQDKLESRVNVLELVEQRYERLLKEFEDGKYQTGPIAGMTPNLRSSAQELERAIVGLTLSEIQATTLGSLSDPEREFLMKATISEGYDEEANIANLKKKIAEGKRLIEQSRGVIEQMKSQPYQGVGTDTRDDVQVLGIRRATQ